MAGLRLNYVHLKIKAHETQINTFEDKFEKIQYHDKYYNDQFFIYVLIKNQGSVRISFVIMDGNPELIEFGGL